MKINDKVKDWEKKNDKDSCTEDGIGRNYIKGPKKKKAKQGISRRLSSSWTHDKYENTVLESFFRAQQKIYPPRNIHDIIPSQLVTKITVRMPAPARSPVVIGV